MKYHKCEAKFKFGDPLFLFFFLQLTPTSRPKVHRLGAVNLQRKRLGYEPSWTRNSCTRFERVTRRIRGLTQWWKSNLSRWQDWVREWYAYGSKINVARTRRNRWCWTRHRPIITTKDPAQTMDRYGDWFSLRDFFLYLFSFEIGQSVPANTQLLNRVVSFVCYHFVLSCHIEDERKLEYLNTGGRWASIGKTFLLHPFLVLLLNSASLVTQNRWTPWEESSC